MATVTQSIPTKEQIQARAYELYLARGCEDGYAIKDWCIAENELMNGSKDDSAVTREENREGIVEKATA